MVRLHVRVPLLLPDMGRVTGHGGALQVPCLEGFNSPTVHQSLRNVSLVDGPPWKWEDAGSNPAGETNTMRH